MVYITPPADQALPESGSTVPGPVRAMCRRGYSVIPQMLVDGGKRPPLGFKWKPWQTEQPSLEHLEYWARKYSPDLWAIVIPEDECRLDFDVQHGAVQGWVGLEPTTYTRSGGVHVAVKVSARVKDLKKVPGIPGLEILGHPHLATFYGEGYEEGMGPKYELEDLPLSLQEAIKGQMWTEQDRQLVQAPIPEGYSDFAPLSVILGEMLEKVNSGEGRNDVGFYGYCQARDERYDQDEVHQFAVEQYLPAVTDLRGHPYTIGEAEESVQSAFSLPPRQPRGLRSQEDRLNQLKVDVRLRRQANREVDEEEAAKAFFPPEYRRTLREELAIEEEPLSFRVGTLLVEGHNARIVGKNKSGKTTVVGNLYRSLLDGTPFLSAFSVQRPSGKVAYWNGELSERQFRAWLREMNIANLDQGVLLHTRGKMMDLSVPVVQSWATEWLKRTEVEVWIIDPFTRYYFGEENSNSEVNRWLERLDAIKDRSGVKELVLVTHEGRAVSVEGEEHTRGASAMEGWADVLWSVAKDGDDRFFGAFGRDVEFRQQKLGYRASDRSLSISGVGRSEERVERGIQWVCEFVRDNPGANTGAVQKMPKGHKDDRLTFLAQAVLRGYIEVEMAARNAKLHRLTCKGREFLGLRTSEMEWEVSGGRTVASSE